MNVFHGLLCAGLLVLASGLPAQEDGLEGDPADAGDSAGTEEQSSPGRTPSGSGGGQEGDDAGSGASPVPGPLSEPPPVGGRAPEPATYPPPAAERQPRRIPNPPRRRPAAPAAPRQGAKMQEGPASPADDSRPVMARLPSQGMSKSLVTGSLSVDYVNEPILDVLRAVATAYKLSIIPDPGISDVRVTIHLENVPVLEGLEKLVRSHGLELIEDGNVFRVRKASEHTTSVLQMQSRRLTMDVKNKPIREFLRDFSEKTRINVIAAQGLEGSVSGRLHDVLPANGLKALMEANGYRVGVKKGVYIVEPADEEAERAPRSHRRGRPPPGGYGGGRLEIDVQEGRVSLNLDNAPLAESIREIAEQAGVNYVFIGEIVGNANAQLQNVSVDDALVALLQGTRYAYINRGGTLLIGDRNPNTPSGQALSGAELYFLRYIKAENIEKVFPKSIPAENIKVIKEQNAVLITGTGEDISLIKSFLEQIDLPTLQVLMEVIVVEYQRGKDSELGLAGGGPPYASGPNARAEVSVPGGKGTFRQGGFMGTIGILPQTFFLNLRALEAKNRAKIHAMPKITTLNGNKAELKVNTTSYYRVSSVTKDGFQSNDFRAIDDGITIELTPFVTNHGEVNVSISPSIKTQRQGEGDGPPPITNRSITTNVSLMDGQTIALGGLINTKEDMRRQFVPVLGSIPLLGYLFSYRKSIKETTELVIYVTPHVLSHESMGVDLEKEFESLDDRSGRVEEGDFLRSTRQRRDRRDENADSTGSAGGADAGEPAKAPEPAGEP